MQREAAFSCANQIVSKLPCRREVVDFWDMPKVDSEVNRLKWRDAADQLEVISMEVPPKNVLNAQRVCEATVAEPG